MLRPINLIRTPTFRLDFVHQDTSLTLLLEGQIDEDVDFEPLHALLSNELAHTVSKIRLDTERLRRMNSCGVRTWLLLIERIGARYETQYTRVNETFIELATITPSMLGNRNSADLKFEAPHFCSNCNERKSIYLSARDFNKDLEEFVPPPATCEKCGNTLDFDAFEEEYHGFIQCIHSREELEEV